MTSEADLRRVTIGEPRRHDAPITLVAYDPGWAVAFEHEAARIRAALGDRALLVEHVGSTSVPGLAAKPIIDMVLAVADSAREEDYVPALEAAGYVLHLREPEWHEHRLFNGPGVAVGLHTFTVGSPEIERMLRFRDHLRSCPEDRARYEAVKRELAGRVWRYTQHYADAKSDVVAEIMARAGAPPA